MRARSRWRCTRLVLLLTALLLVAAATAPPATDPPGAQGVAALVAEAATRPVLPSAPEVVPRDTWDPAGTCPASRGERTRPRRIALHHTHVPVVEAPEEVPGAMQAICRTHRGRGFDDLGYHYAVDPFGTIWQGRGPLPQDLRRRVRTGAHAQGFNDGSIGVVLIGDFDVAPPTPEALAATEELLAFLAGHFDMDPQATVTARSTGGPSTRFAEGASVDLPAIAGHRDTGRDTACPGAHLYALLPQLRERVAARLAAA